MSSPIAIPRVARSDARVESHSQSSPTGLYVPVHRRTPSSSSASSLSSSFDDRVHLSPNTHRGRRSPAPRTRSVSPASAFARQPDSHTHSRRSDPVTPTTPTTLRAPAPIPQASKIPKVYSLTELLALSSSPLVGLSHSQLDDVRAHIPFMTRKSSPSSKSKPKSQPKSQTSSASSSPTASPAPTSAALEEHSPTPAPAPAPVPAPAPAPVASEQQRRRRPAGRNASSGKPRPRVSPAVSTDVESRRRRGANGAAGWGWAPAPSDGANWRLVSAASA